MAFLYQEDGAKLLIENSTARILLELTLVADRHLFDVGQRQYLLDQDGLRDFSDNGKRRRIVDRDKRLVTDNE